VRTHLVGLARFRVLGKVSESLLLTFGHERSSARRGSRATVVPFPSTLLPLVLPPVERWMRVDITLPAELVSRSWLNRTKYFCVNLTRRL
jgi:hypothetical protein